MIGSPSQSRWHGRAAFLATTLLAVSALGGPFLVTRGLIAHGALFLPVLLVLLFVFGAPIVRLALASGQLDNRIAGRDALQPVAMLIRIALAAVLFLVGARACAWVFALTTHELPAGVAGYQAREISVAASSWTLQTGNLIWWGALSLAVCVIMLVLTGRRKRLAGLGWIGGWLLWILVFLFTLGLFAGYALPGAGALAALVVTPRLAPLATAEFWSDAISIALLAVGAQAGMVTASGMALPQRASVGREARILISSIAMVLVLSGLTGLMLLCALCFKQGVIPTPAHADPALLLLELVPALGVDLFPGWPPEFIPNARQVTLGWHFLVTLGAAFGIAALLSSRRWLPSRWKSPAAKAGYLAAAVIMTGIVLDWYRGVPDAAEPITKVLPLLLALMHLTLARRAGPGMRVVSAAFDSQHAWLQRLNVTLAMRVARPGLLLAVPALALALRPHSLALAGLAIGFGILWIGSLHTTPRVRGTGVVRAAALAVVLAFPALALAASEGWPVALGLLQEPDPARRAQAIDELVALRARASGAAGAPPAELRKLLAQRLEQPPDAALSGADRTRLRDQTRDALRGALLLAPEDIELQRLERLQLQQDNVRTVRLDEALAEHAAGRPQALHEQANDIAHNLPAPNLRRLLAATSEPPTVAWNIALCLDLQEAYGTAPPLVQVFRQHLVRRAVNGRSLLRPDAESGAVLLACLGAAALALALSLALGMSPRRGTDR